MQNLHTGKGLAAIAQFLLCSAAIFGTKVSSLAEIARKEVAWQTRRWDEATTNIRKL
jgi:hypothetical protein